MLLLWCTYILVALCVSYLITSNTPHHLFLNIKEDVLEPIIISQPTSSPVAVALESITPVPVAVDTIPFPLQDFTTCSVCPNGLTVNESTIVTQNGENTGLTCIDVVMEALGYEASSTACAALKDAALTCCPISTVIDPPGEDIVDPVIEEEEPTNDNSITTVAPNSMMITSNVPTSPPNNIPLASMEPTTTPQPTTYKPTKSPSTTSAPISSAPTTLAPMVSSSAPISSTPTKQPIIDVIETNPPTTKPITGTPTIPPTTASPTVTPTTSSPTSSTEYTGLQMTLMGISYINDVNEWEGTTSNYYESIYNNAAGIEDTIVEITLTGQTSQLLNRRRKLGKERSARGKEGVRVLQDDTTSVDVTYTQTTYYTSLDDDLAANMDQLLQLPLSTEEYREKYVDQLKLLEGYEDLTSVSSISDSTSVSDNGSDSATDGTNDAGGMNTTGIIIGILLGTAGLLLLVGGIMYWRSKPRENVGTIDHGDASPPGATSNIEHDVQRTPKETLGDMSVGSGDYDFGTGDNDAEELLTVYAPAGKLGMIIDSPDTGAPVIHNLKDTSPISDKVRVGDRLVAVDDEDVRNMTAIKASKLISRNSANPRKLTFIRYLPGSG